MTDPQVDPDKQDLEDKAFQELDTAKVTKQIAPDVEKLAAEKAKEIAAKEVAEMKKDLGRRISGEESSEDSFWSAKDSQGKPAPSDWQEARTKLGDESRKAARDEWNKLEKEKQSKQEKSHKMSQQQEALWSRVSSDSYWEMEAKGLIPSPSDEVRKKVRANLQLTKDEMQNDPGMRAFNEIRVASRQKGKSFKEYVYEDYKKQPPGARAPVLGGAHGSMAASDDEYTYADVQADGKQI